MSLNGAGGITTFESGGRTYAAVSAYDDNGVQILDVTDPYRHHRHRQHHRRRHHTDSLELYDAQRNHHIRVRRSHLRRRCSKFDYGVQILDVTDPYNITAADSITNGGDIMLGGADGIATFESGGRTYAAVTAYSDDTVQILDVTYPYNITAAGSITDPGSLTTPLSLTNPDGIATFESGGSTYLAVAGYDDHGVQILRVDIALGNDTTPPVITVTGPDPATITVGDTYADEGVVCTDDADAAPVLVSNSTVTTSTPGTHVLGYDCTDAAGNDGHTGVKNRGSRGSI